MAQQRWSTEQWTMQTFKKHNMATVLKRLKTTGSVQYKLASSAVSMYQQRVEVLRFEVTNLTIQILFVVKMFLNLTM